MSLICKIGLQGFPSENIFIDFVKNALPSKLFKTISLLKLLLSPKTVAGLKIIKLNLLLLNLSSFFSALYFFLTLFEVFFLSLDFFLLP